MTGAAFYQQLIQQTKSIHPIINLKKTLPRRNHSNEWAQNFMENTNDDHQSVNPWTQGHHHTLFNRCNSRSVHSESKDSTDSDETKKHKSSAQARAIDESLSEHTWHYLPRKQT